MKFSTPHTNRGRNRKNFFHEARLLYFADAKSGAGVGTGTDKNLSPEEELKKRRQDLEKQTDESMRAKMDKLPSSVKSSAKRAWESGNLMEKTLVIQLTENLITGDMFEKMLKCLAGGDNYKTIAEKYIMREIDSAAFEIALRGLDNNNEEIKKLAENLEKGKITGAAFSKQIQKLKKTIKKEEASLITPDQAIRSTQEKLILINETVKERLARKVGSAEDSNKFRSAVEEYNIASKKIFVSIDSLTTLYKEMSGGNESLYNALDNLLYDKELLGNFALFDPVQNNEQPISSDALGAALERLDKQFNVNLAPFKTRMFANTQTFQIDRTELNEAENQIGEIIKPAKFEAEVVKPILEQRVKQAEKWLGIKLDEGTKLKVINIKLNPQTGKQEYFWDETEILSIGFEKPQFVEGADFGRELPFIEGETLIIVTGVGTFTEANLRKWMDACRAHQKIETIEELENVSGLKNCGFKIETGMDLEYTKQEGRDEKNNLKTSVQNVKIEKIHDGKIILSEPVVVLRKDEFGCRPIIEDGKFEPIEHDIEQKEFTYGEFFKWFLRKGARKKLYTAEETNGALKRLNKNSINSYAPPVSIFPGAISFRETPPGAGTEAYRTDGFDDNTGRVQVTSKGGKKSNPTYAQFLDTVRKRDLVDADPEEYAKRAIKNIPEDSPMREEEHENAKQKHKDKIEKSLEEPQEKNEEKKEEKAEERGDPAHLPAISKIGELWKDTTMLSLQDIIFLFKSIYEFHERRWQRKMKHRVGSVGEKIPIIDTEMARMRESSEHEEVEKYKAGLEHLGVPEIREAMHHAGNRDELRACIDILCHKGHMRWDDIDFWRVLNRFTDSDKRIPIPLIKNDPAAKVKQDPITGKWLTGQDLIEAAIDAMWGESMYNGWYNQNNSALKSGMQSYMEKGDELENDPKSTGGLSGEMQKLLTLYVAGQWVNPHEYEGLYRFSIIKGKMRVEDKLYYLVQGVARGLLPMDRIGAVDGELLNHMPWLDYFTNKASWRFGMPEEEKTEINPVTGEPKGNRPYKLADIQRFAAYLNQDGEENKNYRNAPGPRTKHILWKHFLTSRDAKIRTTKAIQEAQRLDHDDVHFIMPLLTESDVEKMCRTGGMTRERFSGPGYLNAYPGFNQYIKTLTESAVGNKEELDDLREVLASFVRYDAILDNRFRKEKIDNYTRIDKHLFKPSPVVDSVSTAHHREVIQNLIKDIGKAYGSSFEKLFEETGSMNNKKEKEKQDKIEEFIENFNINLKRLIEDDNGARMLRVINKAIKDKKLEGYKFLSSEEFLKKKRAAETIRKETSES